MAKEPVTADAPGVLATADAIRRVLGPLDEPKATRHHVIAAYHTRSRGGVGLARGRY